MEIQQTGPAGAVEIREVRPEEYEEAGRVVAAAYREFVPAEGGEGWERYLARVADVAGRADRTVVLVAVDGGRIVGGATIELHDVIGDDDEVLPEGTAVLRMLGVLPEARGRGIARALVEEVIARARAAGKHTLLLRTTRLMRAARRLYESMGFERVPELDLRGPDVELLAYRLHLEASGRPEVGP